MATGSWSWQTAGKGVRSAPSDARLVCSGIDDPGIELEIVALD